MGRGPLLGSRAVGFEMAGKVTLEQELELPPQATGHGGLGAPDERENAADRLHRHARHRFALGPAAADAEAGQGACDGRSRDLSKKNLAPILPVFDVLFGTWQPPEAGCVVGFGIEDPGAPRTFASQLLRPFGELLWSSARRGRD